MLRRFRVYIVAVEKQILSMSVMHVCLHSELCFPECKAQLCHVLYGHLWAHHISPHYFIKGTIAVTFLLYTKRVLIFSARLVCNIPHCKKSLEIYGHKCT
jgi:hypothetical protein